MEQEDYKAITAETAVYPEDEAEAYLGLGIGGESGEVEDTIKKYMRGDYGEEELDERLEKELGDVLWYITRLLDERDLSLDEVRQNNAEKVMGRLEEGTIRGDGEGVTNR